MVLLEYYDVMTSDTVQKIKDRLSIVDVVSQYVKLERSGGALRARCPFHAERTPSFHVSPDRGTYHCFGCGVGGDIFSFIQGIEGLDFKGALKILAEKAGVPLVFSRSEKAGTDDRDRLFSLLETATVFYVDSLTDEAKKYLKERGLNDASMKEFRLGWAGSSWGDAADFLKKKGYSEKEMIDAGLAKKSDRGTLSDKFRNRIMFPISDSAGRVVGFSGRIFGAEASPEAPKYLNSPETPLFHKSRILYGFDKAKLPMRKLNCAILVEGQMDLLASHQAGWGNTVAVSGTAFTADHAALIKRMTENLVIALDPDEAGFKAAGRAARAALASGLNVKVAQLPKGLDPADLIQKEGADAWKKSIAGAKDIVTFLLDVLSEHSKNPEGFRRSVEIVALPFILDVQSPIAREQYIHEISARLGVSESAVIAALAKIPTTEGANPPEAVSSWKRASHDRAKQAYAILLFEKTREAPHWPLEEYARSIEHAIGSAPYKELEQLSESERESLRFEVERLYGPGLSTAADAKTLVRILLRERLSLELQEVTALLRRAEAVGDGVSSGDLMERSRILTGEIAKLHKEE